MQRFVRLLTVIFACASGFTQLLSQTPNSTVRSSVTLESLAGNRLWVRQPEGLRLTPEFDIVATWRDGSRYELQVTDALYELVATMPVPDSILRRFTEKSDFSLTAVLDGTKIAPRFIVGLPRLIPLDSLWPRENVDLGIDIEYRRYDSAQDIRVDWLLGKIDALIMPETEIDDSTWSDLKTPLTVEWYVVAKLKVDELAAAAVNYALKGEFSDSTRVPLSAAYIGRARKFGHPRDSAKAVQLFSAMKKTDLPTKWDFAYQAVCPRILDRLMSRIDRLAGTKSDCSAEPKRDLLLMPYVLDEGDTSFNRTREHMIKVLMASGMTTLMPELEFDFERLARPESDESLMLLLREVAYSCRLIPLGRTKLMMKLGANTRCLQRRDSSISLTSLYRIKE